MNARPHVLWIATHPIQYQAPVFRHLAASSRVTFEAAFLTRHGVESTFDPGFGAEFAWDIPLLDGYTSSFITNARHIDAPVAASAVVRFLATHPATLTVVSGYHAHGLRVALATARLLRRPVALLSESTLESSEARSSVQRVKRGVLGALLHGQWALAPGQRARRYLESLGVRPEHVHPYPYCVDPARLDHAYLEREQTRARCRDSLGIPDDAFVFLFVGKLVEKKRPLELLRAFLSLERGHLVYVGSGELEPTLRAVAGRSPRVHFAGFKNQTELPAYYAASDVLALPSRATETWGLVVNEAMSLGNAIIVSSEAGCSDDLVRGRGTGWVVERPDELATALRAALADPARVAEMGRAARALIEAHRPIHAARGVEDAAIASLAQR